MFIKKNKKSKTPKPSNQNNWIFTYWKKISRKQFISGSILAICVTKSYLKNLPKNQKSNLFENIFILVLFCHHSTSTLKIKPFRSCPTWDNFFFPSNPWQHSLTLARSCLPALFASVRPQALNSAPRKYEFAASSSLDLSLINLM